MLSFICGLSGKAGKVTPGGPRVFFFFSTSYKHKTQFLSRTPWISKTVLFVLIVRQEKFDTARSYWRGTLKILTILLLSSSGGNRAKFITYLSEIRGKLFQLKLPTKTLLDLSNLIKTLQCKRERAYITLEYQKHRVY